MEKFLRNVTSQLWINRTHGVSHYGQTAGKLRIESEILLKTCKSRTCGFILFLIVSLYILRFVEW